MGEVVSIDTPGLRWTRLCAAVRRCQRELTAENIRHAKEAYRAYLDAIGAERGTAA